MVATSRWFAIVALLASVAPASAQSDLDTFMARVLARRDDNWKKLQQYVLEERETFQLTGPGARRLYGSRRESLWYPRDGRFVKSPLTADGVTIGEDERRRAEERWLRREERRAQGGVEDADGKTRVEIGIGPDGVFVRRSDGAVAMDAAMRETLEPGFISTAYFLRFKFDPGRYALVGRETHEGRELLRIEYY